MSSRITEYDLVSKFNRCVQVLANSMVVAYPSDAMLSRIKSKISVGIGLNPYCAILEIGPYLLKYKDQIYNLDDQAEQFFLQSTFDEELNEGTEKEKVDLVSYLIPKVKEHTLTLPPNKKAEYRQIITLMLDVYIDYKINSLEV